jgi:hypothetical protein
MNGFDETELINFRYLVYANIISCLQQLISGIRQINMKITDHDKVLADLPNSSPQHQSLFTGNF